MPCPSKRTRSGLLPEAPEGAQQERALAEGEIAGHVREARAPGGRHGLHDGAVARRPEDDGGPRARSVAAIGQVGPRHEPHAAGAAASPHAAAQPGLEGLRAGDARRHSGYGTSSRAISTSPGNRARASSRSASSSPWRPASMWARMSRRHARARRDLPRLGGRRVHADAARPPLGEGRLVDERVGAARERYHRVAGLGVGRVDDGGPPGASKRSAMLGMPPWAFGDAVSAKLRPACRRQSPRARGTGSHTRGNIPGRSSRPKRPSRARSGASCSSRQARWRGGLPA